MKTISDGYRETVLDMHSKSDWGNSSGQMSGDTIVSFLKSFPDIKTILDYGCGKGSLKIWAEDSGITGREWTLYDPGMPEFQEKPTGKFDLVITTDMLEHVEEKYLDDVIEEINSYTNKYLYNEIACYLARAFFQSGPYKGKDLHINLKAPDEWMVRLDRPDMKSITNTSCVHQGWKVRYLSIQERIVNE